MRGARVYVSAMLTKTSGKRPVSAVLSGALFSLAVLAACSSQSGTAAPDEATASPAPLQAAHSESARATTGPRPRIVASTGLPMNVMPIYKKRQVGVTSNACVGGTPDLQYLGGPVIQSPNIVSVLWTANVDPSVTSQIGSFYTDLMASTYFDMLGEYSTAGVAATDGNPGTTQGITRGKYVGQYTITPSVCAGTAACTVTDAQIASELAAQIAAGHLPEVVTGCDGQVSSLYMFEFPANVTITLTVDGSTSASCSAFCGYHENTTIGGKVVPYGVIPDLESGPCQSACSETADANFNDVTSVHSHEVAEAVTDTEVTITTSGYVRPSAWGDEVCGEVGDICNFQEQSTSLNGTSWTVQQLWSNKVNDCTVTGSPPPVCTGANTPAGCRTCECSDSNYKGPTTTLGCDGATPWCDTTSATTNFGYCVQCTTNSECTSPATCSSANTCSCTAITTCPTGDNCGTISNGCGGTVSCGSACTSPDTCGGGGTPNHCGCTALTTCPTGDNCGTISNGCGGTVSCGSACTSPDTCGGGGTANHCGCTAITTCPTGDNCGTVPDGCGGTVSCGTCTSPQTCAGGGTANVCGCTPATTCPTGDTCGTVSDGCGGTVACGTCAANQTCTNNQCTGGGTSEDGGITLLDAGQGSDGSVVNPNDSGAGPTGGDDSGLEADGSAGQGSGSTGSPSGCSCKTAKPTRSTSPALAGAGALLLLGAIRRRRRRLAA
jgi:MYXO-CTERM domain-containing protein